jgi:hypothetical protein
MNNTVRLVVRVAAILLAARGGVDGQSPAPQGSSNSTVTSSAPALSFQSSLAALQNTNRTLLGQQFTLLSSGATSAQLTAWQQQNSASFAAQQNQVQSLAAQTVPALLPTITDLAVPTDASPELVALLTTKANLLNEDILKNNQLQTAGSVTATAAQPLSATAVAPHPSSRPFSWRAINSCARNFNYITSTSIPILRRGTPPCSSGIKPTRLAFFNCDNWPKPYPPTPTRRIL